MDTDQRFLRTPSTCGRLLAVFALLSACDKEQKSAQGGPGEPPISATDRPFVVFATQSLSIDRIGATVPVPAIVGSTVSPSTVESSDPSVVQVTESGSLYAVGEGHSTIRARDRSGQNLEVEVKAVGSIALVPDALELAPGDEVQLSLVTGEKAVPVDARKAIWASNAPATAIVIEGRVHAGSAPGTAVITAELAGQAARTKVIITREKAAQFSVRPAKPTVKVGEVVTFGASTLDPSQIRRWSARNGSLLHQSGPSTFVGTAPGKTMVCGEATSETSCTEVTVRR